MLLLLLLLLQVASVLMDAEGCVLICGSAHPMPSQVESELLLLLQQQRQLQQQHAQQLLQYKKKKGRYICDTWQ